MRLWRILPSSNDRSSNWRRSTYDGRAGGVIVRADTELGARLLAATAFDRDATEFVSIVSPWMLEDDTLIQPYAGGGFTEDGDAAVLYPLRFD